MGLSRLAERISNKVFTMGLRAVEHITKRLSVVDGDGFFDVTDFPWREQLEENHLLIRRELETVLAGPERIPAFQEVSSCQLREVSGNSQAARGHPWNVDRDVFHPVA